MSFDSRLRSIVDRETRSLVKIKSLFSLPNQWAVVALALSLASPIFGVAGTIVVTPGSLAGYTYFPPAAQASGSGSGSGDNVSTLQRCTWTPSSDDQTVTVTDAYGYNKPVVVYYRMVGGDGGAGANGGGGGSSAIVLNGTPAAIGNGGNGGSPASAVSGTFQISAGNTLRFVTGGGGGDSIGGANYAIGGGGGAGYTGGGGGASINGRAMTGAEAAASSGKGGAVAPGAGGFFAGGLTGTAGLGMQGGVSTWPDGSSAPIGTAGNSYQESMYYSSYSGVSKVVNIRFPALVNRIGSPTGSVDGVSALAGGGGALGEGGSQAIKFNFMYCENAYSSMTTDATKTYLNDNGACYSSYNQYAYYRSTTSKFTPPGTDMQLTRAPASFPANTGYNPINGAAGSLPGQITLMYQAPVCGILQ